MKVEDLHQAMMQTLGIGTLPPDCTCEEEEDLEIAAGDGNENDDEIKFLGIVKKRKMEDEDVAKEEGSEEEPITTPDAENKACEKPVRSPLAKKLRLSQVRKEDVGTARKKLFEETRSSDNLKTGEREGGITDPTTNDELVKGLDHLSINPKEACPPTLHSDTTPQSPATSDKDDSGIYEEDSPDPKRRRTINEPKDDNETAARRSVMQIAESYMRRSYLSDSAVKDFSRRIDVLLKYLEDNCESFHRDDLVDYNSHRFKHLPHINDFVMDSKTVSLSRVFRDRATAAYTKLVYAVGADIDQAGFCRRKNDSRIVWKKEMILDDDLERKFKDIEKKLDPIDFLNQYMSGEFRREMTEIGEDHKLLLEMTKKKNPEEIISSFLNFVLFELLLCTGGQGSDIICGVTDGDWMESSESDEWHKTITVRKMRGKKLIFPKNFRLWIDNYVDIVRPILLRKNVEWNDGGRGLMHPDLPIFLTSDEGRKFQSLDSVCNVVMGKMGVHPCDVIRPDVLRQAMVAWAAKSYPDEIIRYNFAFEAYADGPDF